MKTAAVIWLIGFMFTAEYAYRYTKAFKHRSPTFGEVLSVSVLWPMYLGGALYVQRYPEGAGTVDSQDLKDADD